MTWTNPELTHALRAHIHDVPDFPKPGVIFRDINPLLRNAQLLQAVIKNMAEYARSVKTEAIVGIESRGFFFAAPLALALELPFIPARKRGKLPGTVLAESYSLEYASSTLEVQSAAIENGCRYLIVDDVLATGGTALAAAKLVQKGGGKVCGFTFLIDLLFLEGKANISRHFADIPMQEFLTF